ncbi:uncharacterized protein LOC117642826 [Thrips palmi]|uniref:Uncharacterized protein LOC117642826 n=1 Tax=Thrips palmi TaxID=161013 RepID=A0A6P8YJT2_THRPL|nr:uncharacterized protein LOC117642826 [Thrips palmi]
MDIFETMHDVKRALFLQVAMAVSAVMVECICELYNLFNFCLHTKSGVVNVFWPLLCAVEVTLTLSACQGAQKASDELLEEVEDTLSLPTFPQEALEELKVLRLQLLHLPVRCVALSFLPLDRRVLHGIIATGTTQLVILLQIQFQR